MGIPTPGIPQNSTPIIWHGRGTINATQLRNENLIKYHDNQTSNDIFFQYYIVGPSWISMYIA